MTIQELMVWLQQFPSDTKLYILTEHFNNWSSWCEMKAIKTETDITFDFDKDEKELYIGTNYNGE